MKPLILAVDSSTAMRFLLKTIFGKKYTIVTAADASSAMYWLSYKHFPAVILADPKLSDTAEWEFVTNLKNSFLYKDIPLVILSSVANESVKNYCSIYNIEHCFQKPFNPLLLVETIDELTGMRKTIVADSTF